MNMRRKSFILVAFAAIAAVACGPKVSDKTVFEGTFEADAPQEVNIKIKDFGVDTTITVADGRFAVTLPATRNALATLTVGSVKINFVPDGTPLTANVKGNGEVEIVSKTPSISVQERYKAYDDVLVNFNKEAEAQLAALGDEADDSAKMKIYGAYRTARKEHMQKAFDANKDNIIGAMALNTIRFDLTSPAQLDSMLNLLDPSLADVKIVSMMRKAADAVKNTAEG